MKKHLITLAALALFIGACGGGTTDTTESGAITEETTPPSSDSPPSTDPGSTTTISEGGSVEGTPEPGSGFVTLGDQTYDFDLTTQCEIQGESMAVSGPLSDGSDGSVEGIFPAADQQAEFGPNHVLVLLENSDTWVAHEGYEPTTFEPPIPEESSVTSISMSGSSIAGEGMFWNTGTQETKSGSFAFTCP